MIYAHAELKCVRLGAKAAPIDQKKKLKIIAKIAIKNSKAHISGK